MKNTLLILFLFICFDSAAQKIHFTNENYWYLEGRDSANNFIQQAYGVSGSPSLVGTNYYVNLNRATFINGDLHDDGFVFVREDTLLGVVYYLDNDSIGLQTIERILYDYRVHEGDIIESQNHFFPLVVIDSVIKVDSTLISGKYYKVFTLKKLVDPYSTNFGSDSVHTYIEGIGGVSGAEYRLINQAHRTKVTLKCMLLPDASVPAINCLYSYPGLNDTLRLTLDCSYLSVPEVATSTTTVTITPNPVWDEATISYPASIATGQLQVYDAMGRVVYQAALSGGHSNTLPMGTARPGLYFYRLSDAGSGRVYNGRFVKE